MELVKKECLCGCKLTWKAYPTSKSLYFGKSHETANYKILENLGNQDDSKFSLFKRKEILRQSLGEAFLYG